MSCFERFAWEIKESIDNKVSVIVKVFSIFFTEISKTLHWGNKKVYVQDPNSSFWKYKFILIEKPDQDVTEHFTWTIINWLRK